MGGSPPGSAGVPPAQHWQSLAHLLDPDRPAKTPGLCSGRAHAVPTGTVDRCAIAGKLSDNPRERMRAGRPRSRVGRFRHDCPSRESRRKRTGWMVALNPDFTIPWWITLFRLFQEHLVSHAWSATPQPRRRQLRNIHQSTRQRNPRPAPHGRGPPPCAAAAARRSS